VTYGNYMNQEFMDAFRRTFTDADYQALAQVRAQSGGTKGAACTPNPKPPSQTQPPQPL
jgi:hypothetical protein